MIVVVMLVIKSTSLELESKEVLMVVLICLTAVSEHYNILAFFDFRQALAK